MNWIHVNCITTNGTAFVLFRCSRRNLNDSQGLDNVEKKTIRLRLTYTPLNARDFFFNSVMPCKISFSFFHEYNISEWNTFRCMCNYLYAESRCILIKKYSIDYMRVRAWASSLSKSCAGAFIFTSLPSIRQRTRTQ